MTDSSDHLSRFISSGLASGFAEFITLPTDVAKVRLQLQLNTNVQATTTYNGFVDCLYKTARDESITALWKGLLPALIRQVCYSSMSLVLYEPIRNNVAALLRSKDSTNTPSMLERFGAGGIAGMISIACFNWTEVIKTQMQASPDLTTMRAVTSKIYKNEGLLGFYAGIKPNVIRTFLVNATELGVYDQVKTEVFAPVFGPDNIICHLGASSLAGVASACTSTPADVIKTRLMNQAGGDFISNCPPNYVPYRGFFHTGVRIYKEESLKALYKGFVPICIRKTVWCTAFFLSYEQLRMRLSEFKGNVVL